MARKKYLHLKTFKCIDMATLVLLSIRNTTVLK